MHQRPGLSTIWLCPLLVIKLDFFPSFRNEIDSKLFKWIKLGDFLSHRILLYSEIRYPFYAWSKYAVEYKMSSLKTPLFNFFTEEKNHCENFLDFSFWSLISRTGSTTVISLIIGGRSCVLRITSR